jgi:hypothetical protein
MVVVDLNLCWLKYYFKIVLKSYRADLSFGVIVSIYNNVKGTPKYKQIY